MLSQARARRLARRAEQRGADGARGLLARRAWRRLTRAADSGDPAAVEAVWQAWLPHPDDERWELLVRWRTAREATAGLLAAATDAGRPADQRAEAGAFCARHGIVPADPVARSVFFLLTGQPAQYRAVDPDGSLLALGYAGATDADRTALRAAMAGIAGLDLVRVVLGGGRRGGQPTGLTSEEGRYLAARLADRRDWPGLWQLVTELPVLEAARAMPLFGTGWRPAADRDQALFAALARAHPGQLDRAHRALRAGGELTSAHPASFAGTRMTSIDIRGLAYAALHPGALSAGGQRLAMVTPSKEPPGTSVLNVLARPDEPGARTRREAYHFDCPPGHVIPAFDADILYVSRLTGNPGSAGALARYADGRERPLAALDGGQPRTSILGLAPRVAPGGGLVVLCGDRLLTWDKDHAPRAKRMWVPDVLEVTAASLSRALPDSLATGPGGRAAVAVPGAVVVFDASDPDRISLVATQRLKSGAAEVSFCAPDQIVTVVRAEDTSSAEHDLRLWRLDGDRLELMAARRMPYIRTPIVIPSHGLLAAWSGHMRYLDAQTLADADAPDGFPGWGVHGLWNSPDLRTYALACEDHIQVYDSVPAADTVIGRPPADWVPGDVTVVTDAAAATPQDSAPRPLLDLLLACLEYRFGADVGLAETTGPPGAPGGVTPDDIALSPGAEPG